MLHEESGVAFHQLRPLCQQSDAEDNRVIVRILEIPDEDQIAEFLEDIVIEGGSDRGIDDPSEDAYGDHEEGDETLPEEKADVFLSPQFPIAGGVVDDVGHRDIVKQSVRRFGLVEENGADRHAQQTKDQEDEEKEDSAPEKPKKPKAGDRSQSSCWPRKGDY